MTEPEDILTFWFGQRDSAEYGHARAFWFKKDEHVDTHIREQFLPIFELAAQGKLAGQGLPGWEESPRSLLAEVIVLDQFPRNMFRDSPRAFATDALARDRARMSISRRWDARLLPIEAVFLYLPLEHSESLEDQEQSMALFTSLAERHPGMEGYVDYARRHRGIIARFGRFPHRNAILKRPSTPEEESFLTEPGSRF